MPGEHPGGYPGDVPLAEPGKAGARGVRDTETLKFRGRFGSGKGTEAG